MSRGMVGEWRDGGMSVEGWWESGGMVSTGECRMMTGKAVQKESEIKEVWCVDACLIKSCVVGMEV